MKYLNFINNNFYLYLGIIIALLILNIILTIVCINQRKRRKIKNTFKEIEEIANSEDTKTEEETYKPEVAFELEQILEKMQQDINAEPEEIVKKFEEEQEQKAIISYQELLDSVNNNKIDVVEDEEGETDFVAALEAQMSDIQPETIETPIFDTRLESIDDYANKSHLDIIDELDIDEKPKKFKNSEVLSPVFGRDIPNYEYKTINSFANTNNKVEVEQVAGDSIDNEIKKNEDFLKALIEFRNNL